MDWEGVFVNAESAAESLVCYTAVFSVVTQRSSPLALRDDAKNGCVADYRVTRIIFLVNKYFSIRPFFSKLTLNSTTMQLSFIKDFKEKSFSFNNIFYH